MYPVVSKPPLMEWVHTKMSETKSLEVLNLLKELYDDFNLEDVDPRGITPDDILAMYKEMSNLSLSTNSVTEDCGRI
jgi:hypothetical protein